MTTTPQIIIGLDDRPETAQVIAWATREAALVHASIVLVHAVGGQVASHLDDAPDRVGADIGVVIGQASADARRLVARAHAEIRALDPSVTVAGCVSIGAPAAALQGVVDQAMMVVVGARSGRHQTSTIDDLEALLGADLGCPVVQVSGSGRDGGVLAVVDGTTWSTPVLDAAFDEAALRGLPLTVVQVPEDEDDAGLQRFLRSMLEQQVQELHDLFPAVEVDLVTETTDVDLVLATAPVTTAYVVADTQHLELVPEADIRFLVPTEHRPDPIDDLALTVTVVTSPVTTPAVTVTGQPGDLTAELESWWDLPTREPAVRPAPARRHHRRWFGTQA